MGLINWLKKLIGSNKTILAEQSQEINITATAVSNSSVPYSWTKEGAEELRRSNSFDISKINFNLCPSNDLLNSYEKYFLCVINGKDASLNHLAGYWFRENEINITETVQKLISGGYLVYKNDIGQELQMNTVVTLKEICRQNGLKVSGTKKELSDRIIGNLSEEDIIEVIGKINGVFLATEKSADIIRSYKNHDLHRYEDFYNKLTEHVMNLDYDGAYKACGRDNLQSSKKAKYDLMVKSKGMSREIAYEILFDMTGQTYFRKTETHNSQDSPRQVSRIYSEYAELHNLISSGVEEYRIISVLDKKTCSYCGDFDNKVFKVSEAKIGVNCPPFHEGCRCSIIMNADISNTKRSARDGNGKSILVPATMNYCEWRKRYLKYPEENLRKKVIKASSLNAKPDNDKYLEDEDYFITMLRASLIGIGIYNNEALTTDRRSDGTLVFKLGPYEIGRIKLKGAITKMQIKDEHGVRWINESDAGDYILHIDEWIRYIEKSKIKLKI